MKYMPGLTLSYDNILYHSSMNQLKTPTCLFTHNIMELVIDLLGNFFRYSYRVSYRFFFAWGRDFCAMKLLNTGPCDPL